MGKVRKYIDKKLSEPLNYAHPSRGVELKILRLENLVMSLAEQIDNISEIKKSNL